MPLHIQLAQAPWLPFPAGPMVPPATAVAALTASPAQRAQVALSVVQGEFRRTLDLHQPISKLTALIADAALEWRTHQPALAAELPADQHSAAAHMQCWHPMVARSSDPQRWAETDAVKDFAARLHERFQRRRDTPIEQLPYRLGRQGPHGPQAAGPLPPAPAPPSDPSADAALAKPGGGWRLLACLFL